MITRSRVAPRSHEDFEPSYEWKQEEGSDTLVISLPGFKKEQLKVQLDSTGNLRVRGERPREGQYWSRFSKDFRIPENTRASDIRAKFENEMLSVIMPKFNRSRAKDQPTKVQEADSGKKATTETKPREDQDRMSQKDGPLSSSKSDYTVTNQPNGNTREAGEPANAVKKEQKIEEEKKNQIPKSDDKMAASEISARDAELANSRKRKAAIDDEKPAHGRNGQEVPKPDVGGLGMRFKKPRQLMVNVGVAAVILVGLAFYVSYKLRKSIAADNN